MFLTRTKQMLMVDLRELDYTLKLNVHTFIPVADTRKDRARIASEGSSVWSPSRRSKACVTRAQTVLMCQ